MTPGRGSTYGSVVGGLSLATVALALYLSPVGSSTAIHPRLAVAGQAKARTASGARTEHAPSRGHTPDARRAKVLVKQPTSKAETGRLVRDLIYTPRSTTASTPAPTPAASTKAPSGTGTTSTVPPQASASTQASAPASAATFTVQAKSSLVLPQADYWGVSINGVPQGTPQLNALDAEVGQAPSELTWYQGWDEPYPAQTVQSSWQHGALPMITWESKPSIDSDPAQSDPSYSLSDIINGNYDSYLETFAQGVVSLGLPVVIRLDQEMNGNWFPWSEGINGNQPGQYVQMWHHVWNIFQSAGREQVRHLAVGTQPGRQPRTRSQPERALPG